MPSNEHDWGGLTLVVKDVKVNATAPGQAGTSISAAELTFLDGVTAGTATASKAVVVDSNKDIATLRNITATNLDLGSSGVAGTLDIFPTTASKGKFQIAVTDQSGDTTATLQIGAMTQARTVTLPDPGSSNASILMTSGTASSTAATTSEITRACDVSARLVAVGGTSLAITEALHSDKIIKLDHTGASSTCTLPDATGSGSVFRFIVTAVNTSNHVIHASAASNLMKGSVVLLDNDSNAQTAYAASGTDNAITLNGTTSGGQVGDWLDFVDIAVDTWAVRGFLVCPAGSNVTDPFSAI